MDERLASESQRVRDLIRERACSNLVRSAWGLMEGISKTTVIRVACELRLTSAYQQPTDSVGEMHWERGDALRCIGGRFFIEKNGEGQKKRQP